MFRTLHRATVVAVLLLIPAFCGAQEVVPRNAEVRRLGATLHKKIEDFHRRSPENNERLRVVYFHGKDQPPQADYQGRLQRIMLDVQQFYHQEMKANGFGARPLPLEMKEGRLQIHVVQGARAAESYTYRSGQQIRREAEAALRGKVDFARDFVMVFCGLCQKKPDGSYYFHSPYYGDGGSNHLRGLCYAADCEMLDTQNYTKAREQFRYEEHSGRFKRTLAAFNSLYIGGIAHELGHGLSLPHNSQTAVQRRNLGTALMGSGNYTYRNQLWKGGNGSFMTMASAVRLAAHPLFTGSDRGRRIRSNARFTGLTFQQKGASIRVQGSVEAQLPAIAVIAYADPNGGGDYDAQTTVAAVEDGKFTLEAKHHRGGKSKLHLLAVLANGATHKTSFPYSADRDGTPDIQQIVVQTSLQPIFQLVTSGKRDEAVAAAAKLLKQSPDHPAAGQLKHVSDIFSPAKLIDLAETDAAKVAVSDAQPAHATAGWGRPARNQFDYRATRSRNPFLTIDGQFHAKGLSAHSPSTYTFNLGGKWKTFTTTIGLQDGGFGEAIFTIKGDGKTLHQSKKLKAADHQDITVDVSGIKKLELVVESAVDGNAGCWSVWGSPYLSR